MQFLKALTFSYDDGVKQDRRLAELFRKYGLKATFNLNSGRFNAVGEYTENGHTVDRSRIAPEEVKDIYRGMEVAAHSVTHARLPECTEQEIIRQVDDDRKALSELTGYEVVGFAYACGGYQHDARTEAVIREHTGARYARVIDSTFGFEFPENLYEFKPTIFHVEDIPKMFELGEEFLALRPDRPQLFTVWGHSYELDCYEAWDELERFCRMMSGRDDIFYGTNSEVLLNKWENPHVRR